MSSRFGRDHQLKIGTGEACGLYNTTALSEGASLSAVDQPFHI